jgi:YidC/Oxa1 family membrane protein insertase
MSALLSTILVPAYHAVVALAAILVPLLGGVAPAAAIIVCTALVRLVLHPLNRAQIRAQHRTEQARAALAPAVAKLQRKHKNDPARLLRETSDLYRANGVKTTAGLLPALAQAPLVFVMYRLFVSPTIGGHPNTLLTADLFGARLGSHLREALTGPAASAAHLAVFAALLAVTAAIATWAFLRAKAAAPATLTMPAAPPTRTATATATGTGTSAAPDPTATANATAARLLRLLPYGTVLAAAFVPLATGLYLATTTLWTVVERRALTRRSAAAAG